MKTTLKAFFMSLLLAASASNSAVFADEACYQVQSSGTPTEWSSNWDDAAAPVCWDDNAWASWDFDACCSNDFRAYLGGVYYNRRTHLDGRNGPSIFGLGDGEHRTLQGNFGGVNTGIEYDPLCFIYGRFDFFWGAGTQNGNCIRSNVNEYWLDGRIGWTWGECSPCGWRLTPYTGIGYFWIDNHVKNVYLTQISDYHNFNALYQSWYVPVGIRGEVELMPDFTAGLDVTWMPEFGSRVSLGSNRDIELNNGDFGDRYVWRVEVPLRYLVPCDWDFEVAVVPFWQQLTFGGRDSLEGDTAYGVPKSRTDYWGAKFLLGVRF